MAKLEKFRAAILRDFPSLAAADFTAIGDGWDSAAVDVDGKMIFKFPRNKTACAALRREASILASVRSALSLRTPNLRLHEGPPLYSSHAKLKGQQIEAEDYEALPETVRQRLGEDLARFYAELHGLDMATMKAAGAQPVTGWHQAEAIRERALPLLPRKLRRHAKEVIKAHEKLPPDPFGVVFGFFDGHGWNMAFNAKTQRLVGLYDFADSGFGPPHEDFTYSNAISPDLTARIVAAYERLTGRAIDLRRIDILTGYHYLSELTDFAKDSDRAKEFIRQFEAWVRKHADFASEIARED
jgi:aminoglycoside phosphotransferase (APT) family kinase protein